MAAAREVLVSPDDYTYRAAIMWASSLSHNDLTECGTEKDFACHRLEHELSGLFGVTHGAGLAAIWGSWARYVMEKHLTRFEKFADCPAWYRGDGGLLRGDRYADKYPRTDRSEGD